MLYGLPPWHSKNERLLLRAITSGNLVFLDEKKVISVSAKEFISKLLHRTPSERLGSKADSLEIMSHSWFKGFNWSFFMDKKMAAPIKPIINNDKWLDNFKNNKVQQDFRESMFSPENDKFLLEFQKDFESFNHINKDPDNIYAKRYKNEMQTL